jgi:hypothetical protein
MADIICMECKANVSDEPGYCTECGFPFDNKQPVPSDVAAADPVIEHPADVTADEPAGAPPMVAVAGVGDTATEPGSATPDHVATEEPVVAAQTAGLQQNEAVIDAEPPAAQPNVVVMPQLDTILRSLSAVAIEVKDLQSRVDEIKEELDSRPAPSLDNTEKILADVIGRLDAITSVQNAIKTSVQQDTPDKSKKKLLAAFYKTLNSPNSMFEYMFYICIIQVIFVIVNLFLAAYIVTLVR